MKCHGIRNPQACETISTFARLYNVPRDLVAAIVLVESNANPYAYRAEPHYRYLVDVNTGRPFRRLSTAEIASEKAPHDFPYWSGVSSRDTEWLGQQASWGPMQVMGAVAREYGFKVAFPQLCTWEDGIAYGVRHLQHLVSRFHLQHGWRGVAAAYNAGSPRYDESGRFVNQEYVDRIAEKGGF